VIAFAAQLLDFLTFLPAVAIYGIGGEGNGAMSYAYSLAGIPGLMALKALAALLVLAALAWITKSRGRSLALGFIACYGLLGVTTNLAALYIAVK
jgi:hypothetical protein